MKKINRFNRIKKGLQNLPGIRRPQSETDKIRNQYSWALTPRNKRYNIGIETYFDAMNMPWIKVCIRCITNRVIGLGYQINNPNEEEVNPTTTNYLNNLFKNPMGPSANTFYETYISQMFTSLLGPGDSFARVHHDKIFDNVINGLEFIPMEWMQYFTDTDQWGLKYEDVRFEDTEIIHFFDPGIRGEKWGKSLIDVLADHLTLEIYGLKFNKNIFENDGLDPSGILKYDSDIDPEDIEAEVERIEKDKKENPNGTLILQGGEFVRATSTNKEMQYIELANMIRDITLSVYGVPPAEAGVIESGNLGGGTGESQDKTMKQNITGWLRLFEGAHNKALGRNGFDEVFQFEEIDLENKLQRAQIEDNQVRNGTRYINEIRSGYGLDPVDWGNLPMNYSQYGVAKNPSDITNVENLEQKQVEDNLVKSIRNVREYKNQLYSNNLLSEWSP